MELKQEVTLSDGRVVMVDVTHLKVEDWQALKNPIFSGEADNVIVSKHTGLDVKEIKKLDIQDLRRVVQVMGKLTNSPLSDPS